MKQTYDRHITRMKTFEARRKKRRKLVLKLLGRNLTRKQMADMIGISEGTLRPLLREFGALNPNRVKAATLARAAKQNRVKAKK